MLFSLVAIASVCAPLMATASVPSMSLESERATAESFAGLSKRGCLNETIISQTTLGNGVVLTKTKCHDERSVGEREDGFTERRADIMYACPVGVLRYRPLRLLFFERASTGTGCSTTCYAVRVLAPSHLLLWYLKLLGRS